MKTTWYRRTVYSVLAAVLLISVVACGNQSGVQTKGNDATPTPAPTPAKTEATADVSKNFDPMGKYDPPITITTVKRTNQGTKFSNGDTEENNEWTRLLADYGINVKYLWTADSSQFTNKLNVSIASGEISDITRVDSQTYATFLKNGLAADLTDVYEKYATPLTKEIMKGVYGIDVGKVNGRLMSIPYVDPAYNQPQVLWVRNDWLKKYNLQVPKTIDDLVHVAEVFTKNTGSPTFGIAGKDNFLSDWGGLTGFFNGFDAFPGRYFSTLQTYIKDESGNVVWGGTLPGVKTGLQKLQDMFKAGYIPKDFGTWDSGGKLAEAISGGKVGMFYGQWWLPYWPIPDGQKKDPTMDWIPVSPPSVDGSTAKSIVNFPASSFWVVSKNSKNPEVAVKALNLLIAKVWDPSETKEDYTKYMANGSNDSLIIVQAPIEPERYYRELSAAVQSKDPSKLTLAESATYDPIMKYLANPTDPAAIAAGAAPYRIYADPEHAYFKVVDDINKAGKLIANQYMFIPSESMSAKLPTLIKMQDETMLKIIYGQAPVSDYDKFLDNWKKLGGDPITQEVRDWVAKNGAK